jgi:hypothetical protein
MQSGRSPGSRLCKTFPLKKNSGNRLLQSAPNNTELSLQLREQLPFLTAFPFNLFHQENETKPNALQMYILFLQ